MQEHAYFLFTTCAAAMKRAGYEVTEDEDGFGFSDGPGLDVFMAMLMLGGYSLAMIEDTFDWYFERGIHLDQQAHALMAGPLPADSC